MADALRLEQTLSDPDYARLALRSTVGRVLIYGGLILLSVMAAERIHMGTDALLLSAEDYDFAYKAQNRLQILAVVLSIGLVGAAWRSIGNIREARRLGVRLHPD